MFPLHLRLHFEIACFVPKVSYLLSQKTKKTSKFMKLEAVLFGVILALNDLSDDQNC